ncbi:MAG: bifunctional 5,10-methylenetetrahydrofolate dehydrogenase/5,10-methenyltetrahydrofolate cyclohydrolase [Pyrinomonadaceae bacterium]|nr:bifunctional 5,10-methylenetetrahydrofolate dehydrogenase/5,10-methenyltetrahydrofolate cyclohydrolase [Pyrinomonadaceae bacterium]MDQ3175150.1 bifunctional 5,10-methylenetetrahydrofolate dehydrogenase/5,10-methenyltetrahydrofolate cyclohydrolase [Acidobacteriota bacterium]
MASEEKSTAQISQRAELLDGARIADDIKREVAAEIAQLWRKPEQRPCLAAVRVGDDPASEVYVKNKIRACEEIGIRSEHHALPGSTTASELRELIGSLNARNEIDGILVQMPLPGGIDQAAIIETLNPAKDIDGFHPVNVGRLALGRPTFVPCTPAGIIELLTRSKIPIRGANACVVGRSQIVGRPMAQLLIQNDATVTICHSRTQDLKSVTTQADILVVAIGSPGLIRRDYIKSGATVIDVGMNKISDESVARALFGDEAERRLEIIKKRGYTLVGDVHPAEADEVAGRRTPVPGGVGLLTVAMLMRNTVKAARKRRL